MDQLWNLYFALQLYVYLSILDTEMPYLADLVANEGIKLVEF